MDYRSLALTSCFADFKTFALIFILFLKTNFTVHTILRAVSHLENLCPASLESSHDCVVVASYVTVMVFRFGDFLHLWLGCDASGWGCLCAYPSGMG